MHDYRHFPYLEEMQQRLDQESYLQFEDYQVDDYLFQLPVDLIQKMRTLGDSNKVSAHQLQKFYDLNSYHTSENPLDFWQLTLVELELIGFILQAVKTQQLLEQLNTRYQGVFEPSYIREKLNIAKEQAIHIYYAKESEEPIPDDVICIHLPELDKEVLYQLSQAIAQPYAYHCICIPHRESLEIYGVFDKIASHIQQLTLQLKD